MADLKLYMILDSSGNWGYIQCHSMEAFYERLQNPNKELTDDDMNYLKWAYLSGEFDECEN